MDSEQIRQAIIEGRTALGIELGSTRIKAVLIDHTYSPVASGGHNWENRLENGVWTYRLEDVWTGVQSSFRSLAQDVKSRYSTELVKTDAMGISAMMHGYLVFDKDNNQLVPFRTWRNTITKEAAARLTEELEFNIPQRWSVAHLYQAMLNNEEHVRDIDFLTTLAGYVHFKLTGERVVGIGDASGMFPVNGADFSYNGAMLNKFNALVKDYNLGRKLEDILPKVLNAGEKAGVLTEEGAKLLDTTGHFRAGGPFCPPEGDAGTGMVATNSIAERTGNVSAGTSIFAMTVLEKELSGAYPEIDIVATPAGKPVAMVHCNNCTSDIDSWIKLFGELTEIFGLTVDKSRLYDTLYGKALEGEADGGGLLSYNYYSGEHITALSEGRPLLARTPDSRLTPANLMRTLLYSSMATLRIGMDILNEKENVRIDEMLGHGGLFKTKDVGQALMAAALRAPVTVMDSAGEGGAWGIALLAAYMEDECEDPEEYLQKVFSGRQRIRREPEEKDVQGFAAFMERYKQGLCIERTAAENLTTPEKSPASIGGGLPITVSPRGECRSPASG